MWVKYVSLRYLPSTGCIHVGIVARESIFLICRRKKPSGAVVVQIRHISCFFV